MIDYCVATAIEGIETYEGGSVYCASKSAVRVKTQTASDRMSMLNPLIAKLKRIVAFSFPRPFVLIYAFHAARSGWFDRAFYRGVNPSLPWPYRTFPLLHYIAFGEQAGLQPNPDFSPSAYKRLNVDLNALRHPFLHFVRYGVREARLRGRCRVRPRPRS